MVHSRVYYTSIYICYKSNLFSFLKFTTFDNEITFIFVRSITTYFS